MGSYLKVICINNCIMINENEDWVDEVAEAIKGNSYYLSKIEYEKGNKSVYLYEWDEATRLFWELGLFEAKNFMTPHELRNQIINKILEND